MRDHRTGDIVVSAFLAGAVGGVVTNPIEYLAVNKQTSDSFKVMQAMKRKGIWYDMLFKGT